MTLVKYQHHGEANEYSTLKFSILTLSYSPFSGFTSILPEAVPVQNPGFSHSKAENDIKRNKTNQNAKP